VNSDYAVLALLHLQSNDDDQKIFEHTKTRFFTGFVRCVSAEKTHGMKVLAQSIDLSETTAGLQLAPSIFMRRGNTYLLTYLLAPHSKTTMYKSVQGYGKRIGTHRDRE